MSFNYDDVVPVALNDEQPQLCQILYDDDFKSTMGILLALMKNNEISERALAMTELGIDLLASHYTIWSYRINIVRGLHHDLFKELDWCETIALDNEKNYQIWNYRQLIIEEIMKDEASAARFDPIREFPILFAMLQEDFKNHHVWTYRKWLVQRFDLYDNEREWEFLDNCIELDVRNNSAWCHRFFLKFGRPTEASSTEISEEIAFVKSKIHDSPQNESTWNYLLGIYDKFSLDLRQLEPFCSEFVNLKSIEDDTEDEIDLIRSSYALEVLAKIYRNETSLKIYDLLAQKYDPIRSNYWKYLKSTISV